jgi:hypothetical protein
MPSVACDGAVEAPYVVVMSRILVAAALSATLAGCLPVAGGAIAAAGVGVAAVPLLRHDDGRGGAAAGPAAANDALLVMYGMVMFLGGSVVLVAALL